MKISNNNSKKLQFQYLSCNIKILELRLFLYIPPVPLRTKKFFVHCSNRSYEINFYTSAVQKYIHLHKNKCRIPQTDPALIFDFNTVFRYDFQTASISSVFSSMISSSISSTSSFGSFIRRRAPYNTTTAITIWGRQRLSSQKIPGRLK